MTRWAYRVERERERERERFACFSKAGECSLIIYFVFKIGYWLLGPWLKGISVKATLAGLYIISLNGPGGGVGLVVAIHGSSLWEGRTAFSRPAAQAEGCIDSL